MQVKDRLARIRTDVIDRAEAIFNVAFACNLCRHNLAIAHQFRVFFRRLINSGNMLLGNNQHVRWGLRIDIFKRKRLLVFINFFSRNFAGNDLTEKAISHSLEILANPRSGESMPLVNCKKLKHRGKEAEVLNSKRKNCSSVNPVPLFFKDF